MTKAHAYLRVSGRGQIEGDGFTRQLKATREYAASHDIKIVTSSARKASAEQPNPRIAPRGPIS